jgi:hypothetical protein
MAGYSISQAMLKWEFIKPEVLERDLTNSRRNTMFSQRKPPNYES